MRAPAGVVHSMEGHSGSWRCGLRRSEGVAGRGDWLSIYPVTERSSREAVTIIGRNSDLKVRTRTATVGIRV